MSSDVMRRYAEDSSVLIDGRRFTNSYHQTLRSEIARLIDDVRERGDSAVLDALARFDGIEVTAESLRVAEDEFDAAHVSSEIDRAIDLAISNVRVFNEQQLERSGAWSHEVTPGLVFGEKVTPDRLRRPVHPLGQGLVSERDLPVGRARHRGRCSRDRRGGASCARWLR